MKKVQLWGSCILRFIIALKAKSKVFVESQQSLFVVLKTNLVVVKTKFASSTGEFSFSQKPN